MIGIAIERQKNKMAKIKADSSPTIKQGQYSVPEQWVKELNFFDMTGEKAHVVLVCSYS